jgi:hypothetical protein
MKPRKNYTTHISTLLVALQATTGKVIELGGGQSSTPFLHWVCKAAGRKLISYENHPAYYEYEHTFTSPMHRVIKVDDWDEVPVEPVGVVFIDHHPSERRHVDAIRFKDAADLVVVHDTERQNENYNNDEIFANFKYHYTYKDTRPWTSIVSNKIDVSNFGERYKLICETSR